MAEEYRKKLVIVAGMHRSGTSAVTGAIEGLGIRLGQHLAAAIQGQNDKGFKEDVKVIDLHEDLLWALSSAWDDILPLDLSRLSTDDRRQAKARIREILGEYFQDHACCGVKDPRICLFLPLWQEVCREDGLSVCFIIPYRNPYAVAASLSKRDGCLESRSSILWTKYLLSAEQYSRDHERLFLSYDQLVKDPSRALETVLDRLNLPVSGQREDVIRRGAAFITPGLNRSGETERSGSAPQSFPDNLFACLQAVDGRDAEPAENQQFDEIAAEYQAYIDQLDPVLVDQIDSFKRHAQTFRQYWKDALNSRSVKFSRMMKRMTGKGN